MKNKKVSFILPTYNEKENITELIEQIYFYSGKDLCEVIVVDDNSPDETWEIVKNLQKRYKSLRLIRRINKRGLPSAIWTGIKKAKGNIIVWLDCDLSHPPKIIPKLLEYFPKYDIVCASRYVKGGKDKRSIVRVLSSKVLNIIANFVLGLNVKDLTSGFYAVKKKVFSQVQLIKTGYAEYCIRFSYDAIKNGYRIKEVGYEFIDRKKGNSKTQESFGKYFYNGYLCCKEIIRLRMRN